MNLVFVAAFIAACGAAKLDRTYLPPSAKTAGGSHEFLQTPLVKSSQESLPAGGYENEFQGIVVDAALADTRASSPVQTGLGGPRITYGSTDSKVGAAAFRDTATLNQNNPAGNHESTGIFPIAGFRQPQYPETDKVERIQAARDRNSNIIRYQNNGGQDNFNYAFETDNGILAEVNGVAVNGVKAQGGYSYTGDDGKIYSVTYTADEGGYQPKGAHIPTPPPIPVEILEALEKNAKDEAAGIIDDGSYNAEKYKTSNEDYTNNDNNKYLHRQSYYNQPRPNYDSGTIYTENSQNLGRPNYAEQYRDVNVYHKSQIPTLNSLKDMIANNQFESLLNNGNRVPPNVQYNDNINSSQYGSNNTKILPKDQGSEIQQTPGISFSSSLPISQQKLQDQSIADKSTTTTNFVRPTSYDIPLSGYFPDLQSQSKPETFNSLVAEQFNRLSNQFTARPSQSIQPGTFASVPDMTNVQSQFEASSKPFSSFINPAAISLSFGTQQQKGHTNPLPTDNLFNQLSQLSRNQADLSAPAINLNQQLFSNNQLNTEFSAALKPNEPNNNSQYFSTSFDRTKPVNPIVDKDYKFSNPVGTQLGSNYHLTSQYSQTTSSGNPYFFGQSSNAFGEKLQEKATELPSLKPSQSNSPINLFSQNQRFQEPNNFPNLKPSLILTTPKRDMFQVPNEIAFNGLTQASISSFPFITHASSSYSQQPSNEFGSSTSQQFGQFYSPSSFSQLGTSNSRDDKNNIQLPPQGQTLLADDVPEDKKSNVQSLKPTSKGEIYEYNKPIQSVFPSSPEQAILSQTNTQNMNIGFQFNSPFGQKNNIVNSETPLNPILNTQQTLNNQFSQGDQKQNAPLPEVIFSRPKPLGSRPQSSLFGCCSISKPQILGNPTAGDKKIQQFEQNSANIYKQDENKSAIIPHLPGIQSQPDGPISTGKGEEFTATHEQPSFDDSGYHY